MKGPEKYEPSVTREQLDELERRLQPVIAKFLQEPESDTTVAITCTPVPDDPDGAAVMRFEVKVRGQGISPDQDEKLAKLLCGPDSTKLVKTKG